MSNASRSNSRKPGVPVRVIAIHTTEGTSYTAEQLRDADWWEGSAHAIFSDGTDEVPDALTDEDDEVTEVNGGVPVSRASWTLRTYGNPISVNAELVGYASWPREKWLTRWRQLNRLALWMAQMSKKFDIPLQKIDGKQMRAGKYGVIGHIDYTEGYKDIDPGATHWDPGPGFPYDVVIAKAKQYLAAELEPNMTPEQAKQLDDVHHALCDKVVGGRTLADAIRLLATDKHTVEFDDKSQYEATLPRFALGTHELVTEIKDLVLKLVPATPAPAKTTTAAKK